MESRARQGGLREAQQKAGGKGIKGALDASFVYVVKVRAACEEKREGGEQNELFRTSVLPGVRMCCPDFPSRTWWYPTSSLMNNFPRLSLGRPLGGQWWKTAAFS